MAAEKDLQIADGGGKKKKIIMGTKNREIKALTILTTVAAEIDNKF